MALAGAHLDEHALHHARRLARHHVLVQHAIVVGKSRRKQRWESVTTTKQVGALLLGDSFGWLGGDLDESERRSLARVVRSTRCRQLRRGRGTGSAMASTSEARAAWSGERLGPSTARRVLMSVLRS